MSAPSKSSSTVLKRALVGSFFIHFALLFFFVHWAHPISNGARVNEQPLSVSLVMQGAETIEPVVTSPMTEGTPIPEVEGAATVIPNSISTSSQSTNTTSDKVLTHPARIVTFVDMKLPNDTINLGGTIKLQVTLNEFGKPVQSSIVEESPEGYFGEWALEMINHGTYEAARQNGIGVASTIVVMFTIESGGYQSSIGR